MPYIDLPVSKSLRPQEIKPVNTKGNQSWIFIGRTNAKDEAPILWPPDVKNRLIGKDPDAGKDWRQEEKMTEDEMVERYHCSMDMSLSKLQNLVMDREAWRAAAHGVSNTWTWLSNWTDLIYLLLAFSLWFIFPFYIRENKVLHSV